MEKKEMAVALDRAIDLLSKIYVVGDAVDAMATAKAMIRKVKTEINKQEVKDNE